MDVNSSLAAQAYKNIQTLAPGQDARSPVVEEPVRAFAAEFVETLREGEKVAQDAMTGKADMHSVVEALSATKLAVETAVTVRDKVVEAYQEILRMPV